MRDGMFERELLQILATHNVRKNAGEGGVVELVDLFGASSDEFWLWCLSDGFKTNALLKTLVPDLPDESTQERFTGQSGRETLEQAMGFKSVCLNGITELGLSIARNHRLLDFGCGWGRITRVFLNNFLVDNLFATDVLEEAIEICKKCRIPAHISKTPSRPPTGFSDEFFDVVVSYSVFSHLSKEYFEAWVHEFHRVLRPGGVTFLTTRPREAIQWFKDLRESDDVPEFALGAAKSFLDCEAAFAKYDAGEFCFDPEGSGGEGLTGFYGESCIPTEFVMRTFGDFFDVVKMVHFSEHNRFDQNLIVLKK